MKKKPLDLARGKQKKVVIIGGGTGTFTVLTALKSYPLSLTAIVSMADDGGSTGALRDQYGVLPPGDVRRALVALSESGDTLRALFNYRFSTGDFEGHSFGNIFLSALHKITGDFGSAVKEASRVLNIKGKVFPVTLDNVRLSARLSDGSVLEGETNIDIPKQGRKRGRITEVWLTPRARINPEARQAILEADAMVIGPGDMYTSLIPNLLVEGVSEAIRNSPAKKIYICNLMTKFGETDGFVAEDFVKTLEQYLGPGSIDIAVFNNRKPSDKILFSYKKEGSVFVPPPKNAMGNMRSISVDLLDAGPLIRHNANKKLAKVLMSLL